MATKKVCPNEECLSSDFVHKSETPTPCFDNNYFCRTCGNKFKEPKEVESDLVTASQDDESHGR